MYDYRALPRPDSVIGEDLARGAGWSYDACVPLSLLRLHGRGTDVPCATLLYSNDPQRQARVGLVRHAQRRRDQGALHTRAGPRRGHVLGVGRRASLPLPPARRRPTLTPASLACVLMRQDLRPADSLQDHALVPIVVNELGGIDRGQTNCLVYGDSKWDNLRKGL